MICVLAAYAHVHVYAIYWRLFPSSSLHAHGKTHNNRVWMVNSLARVCVLHTAHTAHTVQPYMYCMNTPINAYHTLNWVPMHSLLQEEVSAHALQPCQHTHTHALTQTRTHIHTHDHTPTHSQVGTYLIRFSSKSGSFALCYNKKKEGKIKPKTSLIWLRNGEFTYEGSPKTYKSMAALAKALRYVCEV